MKDTVGVAAPAFLRPALALVLLMMACRLVLALVLIPPWQQPDEPAHVTYAQAAKSRWTQEPAADPGRERETLISMRRHDWWAYRGIASPEPLPTRFQSLRPEHALEVLGIRVTEAASYPRPYYVAAGAMLTIAQAGSVTREMYLMRSLSAVLALFTVWVAWCAAREVFDAGAALAAAAMMALHPQFLSVSTSAGPDAVVNLAAAVLWWQALRALRTGGIRYLAGVWVAAVVAGGIDRMGVPLLAGALVVTVIVVMRQGMRSPTTWRVGLAVAGVLALAAGGYWRQVVDESLRVAVRASVSWDLLADFSMVLYNTWWLALGWARYMAPSWWMLAVTVISAAALWGLVRRVGASPSFRANAWIALAAVMVGIQVLAVYWTFFRPAVGPQGRYLFPVLVPTLMLMWAGWEGCVPSRYRSVLPVAAVTVFACLDTAAWLVIGLSAYGGS